MIIHELRIRINSIILTHTLCHITTNPLYNFHHNFLFLFSGLSLELNIEQEQYVGAITQEVGVRIDISNQGEMPFPYDKGLSVAPGYATSIGMRKVEP